MHLTRTPQAPPVTAEILDSAESRKCGGEGEEEGWRQGRVGRWVGGGGRG